MPIQIRTTLDEPETGQAFVPHRPERPEKAEGGKKFVLKSDYEPAGDQPTAIKELVEGIREDGSMWAGSGNISLNRTGQRRTGSPSCPIRRISFDSSKCFR